MNLGPSLGTRQVVISGALAAVVEFQDTYDGGAIGNVNIKLLPSDKTLTTSSVPLLWNDTVADPAARSDANWLASLARPGGQLAALQSYADSPANESGCGDWTTNAGEGGSYAAAAAGPGYKALFHDAPDELRRRDRRRPARLPGPHVGRKPERRVPAGQRRRRRPANIRAGAITGNNDWIGPNSSPFPTGSAPAASPAGGRAAPFCARPHCRWASRPAASR